MDRTEAQSFIGHKVRGSIIDEVSACRGPNDGRIYLMSEGERVIEVSQLDHGHVTNLGTVRLHTGRKAGHQGPHKPRVKA